MEDRDYRILGLYSFVVMLPTFLFFAKNLLTYGDGRLVFGPIAGLIIYGPVFFYVVKMAVSDGYKKVMGTEYRTCKKCKKNKSFSSFDK